MVMIKILVISCCSPQNNQMYILEFIKSIEKVYFSDYSQNNHDLIDVLNISSK